MRGEWQREVGGMGVKLQRPLDINIPDLLQVFQEAMRVQGFCVCLAPPPQ